LAFARAARKKINGALVRCEERYPQAGIHSVLYVVVEGEVPRWRPHLDELHAEFFRKTDPDPVRLEIIDRATDEALRRLIEAGVIAGTIRAVRPLEESDEPSAALPPLTELERAQVRSHREQAERRLKMARVLGEARFVEEARTSLLEAAVDLARALAVEARLPVPASLDESFRPPLLHRWPETGPVLQAFAQDKNASWETAAEALSKTMAS
jgi:hypothetical protein